MKNNIRHSLRRPFHLPLLLIMFLFVTACTQESYTTIESNLQVEVGKTATLIITRHSKGFKQENKMGEGDFAYTLMANDPLQAVVEIMDDTAHNYCMYSNINTKAGLNQKSVYKCKINSVAAGTDTILFYIDCAKPIYRIISEDSVVDCKLMVTNHIFGEITDTVQIAIRR